MQNPIKRKNNGSLTNVELNISLTMLNEQRSTMNTLDMVLLYSHRA